MSKGINGDVVDALLNHIRNNCDKIVLCSADPGLNYTQANATYALADAAAAPGDFTLANGDINGRKLTVGAKPATAVDVAGTGNHLAYLQTGATKVLAVTTTPSTAVNLGGTVDIGSNKIEVNLNA